MKLNMITTGSKGNCLLLAGVRETIMIEQGVDIKLIKQALNYDFNNVICGLLSHEHKDHSKSSLKIANMGINVYTSAGTASKLGEKSYFINPVKSEQIIETDEFKILFFDTQHDCAEPLGFLIYNKIEHKKVLFATDTYFLKYKFSRVDYFILEVNYIRSILDENLNSGLLPKTVKRRILESHFSLENAVKFLKSSDLSIAKKIIPIHLSSNNADPAKIKEVLERETGIKTVVIKSGIIKL